MYYKEIKVSQVNFLRSSRTIQYTSQVDKDTPGKVDGIIPAGTIIPANDGTAQGITVNSVDVTNGAQPVAMVVEGHILFDRLPVAPTDEAKAALKNITFYDNEGKIK